MQTKIPTQEQSIDAACKIDGWLTREEAATLYGLAFNASLPIVEIGSFQGRSTTALALGAMAGRKSQVYAIDPFTGVDGKHTTSLGSDPGLPCSAELLRNNLDSAGVNGLVKIIPTTSNRAIPQIPEQIGLLFVDGAHDYESVCCDLDNYLPRLALGGFLVLHDAVRSDKGEGEPGVVRAVEDKIRSKPNQLRIIDRVGTAIVVRKVNTTRRVVELMCPGRGYDWGTLTGIVQSTLGAHQIDLSNNGNGWDDFNHLWSRALNRFEAGEITHAAMLHSDISPQPGFVDILMDEMEELDLDMLSVACAMKDKRGVCNCGIGITSNRWGAWRRLTVREVLKLPPTFGLTDLAQRGFCGSDVSDKVLLHNTGCFLVDLRKPVFRQTDTNGNLIAWFDFPTKIQRGPDGKWLNMRESEDWFFSRQLHSIGAKTKITRKVGLIHEGKQGFSNSEEWGEYESDNDTRSLWDKTCN